MQHSAVELGQKDVHRQVGRPEPARALRPGRTPCGCNHGLEHGHIDVVERRRFAAARSRGKRGRGHDDRGFEACERRAYELRRRLILEARHHQRGRRKTPIRQSLAQRIDRRRICGEQHRAIEDDRNSGTALRAIRDESVEVDGAYLGDVSRCARHRARLRHIDDRSRMAREAPKQRCQIL